MIDGKTRICGLFGNPVAVSYTHLDVYKRQPPNPQTPPPLPYFVFFTWYNWQEL